MWEQGGTTDEREKNTPTFDEITHNEIELETEVQGKIIRVYWAPDKQWCTGQVGEYDAASHSHTINYNDGDIELLNMIQLDEERPAWELSPFTKEYFGF